MKMFIPILNTLMLKWPITAIRYQNNYLLDT